MEHNDTPEKFTCKLPHYTPEKGKRRYSHYVVWSGRKPGIYKTWDECNNQVKGFKNAAYRGFYDLESAVASYKREEEGPLSSGGSLRDTCSERCPNCDHLSMKIKLLETELAYYREKLQNSPSSL